MIFISDIHGCIDSLHAALAFKDKLNAKHIMLLGDVLNHGPRNPVPAGYNPAAVATELNKHADSIIAVRGNCDSEVDQMLCQFPMMADYNWLIVNGRRLCLTHGHLFSPDNRPPLAAGDGLVFGHTHLPVAAIEDDVLLFNPGSVTIPKGGNVASFGYFDGQRFSVRELATGQEMIAIDWF
ncbi:phosphodiesterase [Neiella marina]|uniref:Phosphoesterase n=1 Tax=Neiella holothuriorum TaxID=2870530 RepID=A0ABS7EF76_9GAMM|nr:phosphodiesterase [Neiella holothuriorum]MBW8190999.1 phosphodiesterase [Neiella holothuriorum]